MKNILLTFICITLLLTACGDKEYVPKQVVVDRNELHQATIPYENIDGLIVVQLSLTLNQQIFR